MAVDRGLALHYPDLATKVEVIPSLEARLVLIDPNHEMDHFHVLQGLHDSADGRCYWYQRWGLTGTMGDCKVEGPMDQHVVENLLAKVFKEKTGHAWGSLKPGDRVQPGKYWLQQQSTPDLKAKWQYFVSDGVDGKKTDWYDYVPTASDEVEALYAQHIANARERRTAMRVVSSGTYKYKVDLVKMTQQNTKTNKVREIRRALGPDTVSSRKAKAMKSMKSMKKLATAMKSMKAAVMKVKKKTKVSKIARGKLAKVMVFKGRKEKTPGGLKMEDIMRNKRGKYVSKKQCAHGKKAFKNIVKWVVSVMKAREVLGITGFKGVKRGTGFYRKSHQLYADKRDEFLNDLGLGKA